MGARFSRLLRRSIAPWPDARRGAATLNCPLVPRRNVRTRNTKGSAVRSWETRPMRRFCWLRASVVSSSVTSFVNVAGARCTGLSNSKVVFGSFVFNVPVVFAYTRQVTTGCKKNSGFVRQKNEDSVQVSRTVGGRSLFSDFWSTGDQKSVFLAFQCRAWQKARKAPRKQRRWSIRSLQSKRLK